MVKLHIGSELCKEGANKKWKKQSADLLCPVHNCNPDDAHYDDENRDITMSYRRSCLGINPNRVSQGRLRPQQEEPAIRCISSTGANEGWSRNKWLGQLILGKTQDTIIRRHWSSTWQALSIKETLERKPMISLNPSQRKLHRKLQSNGMGVVPLIFTILLARDTAGHRPCLVAST